MKVDELGNTALTKNTRNSQQLFLKFNCYSLLEGLFSQTQTQWNHVIRDIATSHTKCEQHCKGGKAGMQEKNLCTYDYRLPKKRIRRYEYSVI